MQNITKRCPETIGVDILGLADNWLLSGENGDQSLRMLLIDIGGRCSFPINQLDHCNWKSIAPLDSVTYWRAMQVAKLPKQSIQFDNQIAHL